MKSGLNSPSARAYRKLVKTKTALCKKGITGRAFDVAFAKAADPYFNAARKAGKPKDEIYKVIDRVKGKGCGTKRTPTRRRRAA